MNVVGPGASAVVLAPAKLNLFFEVLGKRDDGYHEIETLMVPIALWDTLVATSVPSGEVQVDCRIASPASDSESNFPSSRDNLVTKVLLRLKQAARVDAGMDVTLVKRIPLAAGLGGGSSDAASALLAANRLWNVGWPPEDLAALAAELGSDIPFFLAGGAAICRGRGERIEPLGAIAPLHVAVVRPPQGLSTASVYAACQPANETDGAAQLFEVLQCGDLRKVARLLHNRLEDAASGLSPWIGRLRDAFAKSDCLAAQMTGSGSSYFGICHSARHARHVANQLDAQGLGQTFAVSTCRFHHEAFATSATMRN